MATTIRIPGILQNKGRGTKNQSHLTKLCSIHQKIRGISVLDEDGYGGHICSPGNECKISPVSGLLPNPPKGTVPDCGTALCERHKKTRALTCLEEDGRGGYQCTRSFECKGAYQSEVPLGHFPGQYTHATCLVHHKTRGISVLRKIRGGYQCVKGSECKVSESGNTQRAPAQQVEQEFCVAHHKMRAITCLIDQQNGTYACSPEFECKERSDPWKAPAAQFVCSVHNKLRLVECLEENGSGGMHCSLANTCKM